MSNKIKLIKQEIERRINDLWHLLPEGERVLQDKFTKEDANNLGKYTALESLLKFIDSLPEEPESEDLEEEIKRYSKDILILPLSGDRWQTMEITEGNWIDIARHFAKWQKQQMMKYFEKLDLNGGLNNDRQSTEN